jgi:hypothetical protein
MARGFGLRFNGRDVRKWAARYEYGDDSVLVTIGTKARKRGYLLGGELRAVARWKTPRSAPRIARNGEEFVRDTTRVALSTKCERLRIEVLTLLDGVKWPTASVILHFAYPDRYPILDYRALWSLGVDPVPPCTFELWERYVHFTRATARRLKVSMRELDRALWQYSKAMQR